VNSLHDLLRWLANAPEGTSVPAASLAEILRPLADSLSTPEPQPEPAPTPSLGWREKFWLVPGETRLGLVELTEALGKPKSWVYRHTSEKSGLPRIPHRKLDGSLIFVVGEVRAWLREHEESVHEGPMESTSTERGGLRAINPRKAS
jgi:predicted DNA-binding transcriptional regulator AlpA